MPARTNARPPRASAPSAGNDVTSLLARLERLSTRRDRENLARFGITAANAVGVSVANIQRLAKQVGRDHALARALWDTGCYEARMLASFVGVPERVTPGEMDRWCRDFDNWAICDTVCFHLYDRTPHAWRKVEQWSGKRAEFVKRAAFALIAGLALHDKAASDERFVRTLALMEAAASDDRPLVKKGVSWALRVVGRRNAALNTAALETARRLAASADAPARWIGKQAVKELTGPVVRRQLARRAH